MSLEKYLHWLDWISNCKQIQAFQGAKITRILSDQGSEFVNQEFETHARLRGIHLATSPAYQPQSNGVAERMVGLAKQCTRRLLLASRLPDIYWSYAVRFAAEMLQAQGVRLFLEYARILVKKWVYGDHRTRS